MRRKNYQSFDQLLSALNSLFDQAGVGRQDGPLGQVAPRWIDGSGRSYEIEARRVGDSRAAIAFHNPQADDTIELFDVSDTALNFVEGQTSHPTELDGVALPEAHPTLIQVGQRLWGGGGFDILHGYAGVFRPAENASPGTPAVKKFEFESGLGG